MKLSLSQFLKPIGEQFGAIKEIAGENISKLPKFRHIAKEAGITAVEKVGKPVLGLVEDLPIIRTIAQKKPSLKEFLSAPIAPKAKSEILEATKREIQKARAEGKSEEEVKRITEKGIAQAKIGLRAEDVGAAALGFLGIAPKGVGAFKEPIKKVIKKIIPKVSKEGVKVMDLIKQKVVNVDKAVFESEVFIREFESGLSKAERQAIPFIRQQIKNPEVLSKIGKDELIPIIKNPSPKVVQATEKIGQYYDEAHQFLKENWGDVGFVDDYVNQIWDIPKNRTKEVISYFTTHNPFTKQRIIPTLEEGINIGLKPKTTDIVELLRIYDQYKIKTAYNLKFAKGLTELADETGQKLVQRVDKAPVEWITIDHPALRRAMAIGKVGEEGVLLMKTPVKVHPDIAKEVKIIFDKPFSHKAIMALETVNAFLKKSMLSFSFFHHFALTESAFSSGIGKKTIKLWNPYKIYRALRFKDYEIFKRIPATKDAIDHGVVFGALPDVQIGKVRQALIKLEDITKKIPIIKTLTKGLRNVNDLWDRALWDYYHNTLKLYAYEDQIVKEIKRINPKSTEELNNIKNSIGEFVNDSFGGQRWEFSRMFGNPKMRQMAHWILLAPDWTISTLKQAAAPIRGVITKKSSMAVRGTKFWIRAAFYYNLVAQSVNYYNSKKYLSDGKFTWENDPGHSLDIFAGFNEDGTKRFIRLGKQFREVIEWLYEPEKKLGAKLSPALREAMRQFTKHDPGSGFPTKFEEQEFFESIPERVKSIAEMPLPFSLRPYIQDRPQMFMFALPASRGMTNYKTVDLFKKAILKQNIQEVKKIYISALENNLDAEQLFKSARSSVKADITYDNKQIAKDILNELKNLNPQARLDAIKLYKDRGILTSDIEKKMIDLIKKEAGIQKQKEKAGLR